MKKANTINIKVMETDLFNSLILKREREKKKLIIVLFELKKRPLKASEIEKIYGTSTAYSMMNRLLTSGMAKKNKEGKYVLSKHFSEILRKFAQEWEEFVDG